MAFLWGSQAFRASVAPDAARQATFVLLAIASFAWLGWMGLRPVVIADESGVRIRNFFSSERLSWSEIAGFRLGRYKFLNDVCLIDLKDGTSTHASAIAVPKINQGREVTSESRMVDELNARLARYNGVAER
jgi:hypothetical protein